MLNFLQYEVYLTEGTLNFLHAYCHSLIIFKNNHFKNNSLKNTISVSNSLDPDQAQHAVWPDLGKTVCQSFGHWSKFIIPLKCSR